MKRCRKLLLLKTPLSMMLCGDDGDVVRSIEKWKMH